MVGLVIVSHSSRLAEGVAEVARELAGAEVRIATAGGLEGPERLLGIDARLVAQAIASVLSEEGVLVLVDVGSAMPGAELALELLPPEVRRSVLLCDAPLVEGAVAAAAQARLGASLQQVAAEARLGLVARQRPLAQQPPPRAVPPQHTPPGAWLQGVTASPGTGIGLATRLPEVRVEEFLEEAAAPLEEWARLQRAIETARKDLAAMRAALASQADSNTAEIFDAHLLLLEDDELTRLVREAIHLGALGAAAAWKAAVEELVLRYESLADDYLRSRAADVRDVGRQVLAALLGHPPLAAATPLSGVLIARDFAPSDVARLDPRSVQGLCAARGAITSHAAILARALGIPAVFGLGEELLQVEEGSLLILDGTAARVCVRPDSAVLAEYQQRVSDELQAREAARQESRQPVVTRDGQRVEVAANIGSVEEARAAGAAGADSVGLLRTEFLFLRRATAPSEEEQYEAYRAAAQALEGRSVIIRTLDIGGDKPLPYLDMGQEANPFLGQRGVRFCLTHPELFTTQLRAIARAAEELPIRVMFPMVTALEEWRAARALWEEAARPFPNARRAEVGLMIEVPSAALLAPHLAQEASFFSLGTNDLTQYVFAAERGNASVAHLADPLHPALLQLVARVTEAAHARGRRVGVCGELAGEVLAAPLLVGLGVDELSMSVPAIALVKQALRACHAGEARALAQRALTCASAAEVRRLLAEQAGPR